MYFLPYRSVSKKYELHFMTTLSRISSTLGLEGIGTSTWYILWYTHALIGHSFGGGEGYYLQETLINLMNFFQKTSPKRACSNKSCHNYPSWPHTFVYACLNRSPTLVFKQFIVVRKEKDAMLDDRHPGWSWPSITLC